MVHIRPFQGFVAKKELAQSLISHPYDVVDTNEARELAKGNDVRIFSNIFMYKIISYKGLISTCQ